MLFRSEVASRQPRAIPLAIAAAAATLSNPLHPLLLAPLLVGMVFLTSGQRRVLSFGAVPLIIGLFVNVLNVGASGHDEKITSFWTGAGLFWVSGQMLPTAIALVGLGLSVRNIRAASERQLFVGHVFVLVVLLAVASYQQIGRAHV